MNDRAVEAALRDIGKDLQNIQGVLKGQGHTLERVVNHQGRLIDILEKIIKKE